MTELVPSGPREPFHHDAVACRLDPQALAAQRERYRRLGATAERIERDRGTIAVRFGPGLDRPLLEETIGIEQGCCPFFSFDYSPVDRLLRIGVEGAGQEAALDALAFALGAGSPGAASRACA